MTTPGMLAELMGQMQAHLPMPAFPTKEIVRTLRRQGARVSVDRALAVRSVVYLGDEGGIACDVTPAQEAKERLLPCVSSGNYDKVKTAPGVYTGDLYTTTGPSITAVPWDPSLVGRNVVGSGTFTFSDANNGMFRYTVNGITQSKPIMRLIYSTPATVCR